MHDNADAAQTRAPFEAAKYIVVEFQRFFGNGQREFAGLHDEGLACGDAYSAHQILDSGLIAQIDEGVAAVFEDAEFTTQAEVDRTTPELFRGQRGRDFDLVL